MPCFTSTLQRPASRINPRRAMRRIFGILLFVVGAVLGTMWYVHRTKVRALNSGEVFVRQPNGSTVPLATPSAPPGPSVQSQPAAPAVTAPQSGQTAPAPALPAPNANTPAQPQAASPRHADTMPRNPPNGALYAGSGKYQLYRQGDITWRLNTDTGWACVLLATDAQWRKPRVWEAGCATGGDGEHTPRSGRGN